MNERLSLGPGQSIHNAVLMTNPVLMTNHVPSRKHQNIPVVSVYLSNVEQLKLTGELHSRTISTYK